MQTNTPTGGEATPTAEGHQPTNSSAPEKPPRPVSAEVALTASAGKATAESATVCDEQARAHILDFLLRSCYKETALAFVANDPLRQSATLEASVLNSLDQRAVVTKLLVVGDVMAALAAADSLLSAFEAMQPRVAGAKGEKQFWSVRESLPALYFELACQHFIELVRRGSAGEALLFAQDKLAPLAKDEPAKMVALQDITVLLAFDDPSKSPGGSLLDPGRREILATALNDHLYRACKKIGSSLGGGASQSDENASARRQSSLERVLRQVDVCGSMLRPAWSLKDVLL